MKFKTLAANSRFAKAGVSCFYESEELNSSFVHLMNFSTDRQFSHDRRDLLSVPVKK